MSFPTKDERKKCWDARDRYWECLDGTAEEKDQCLALRKTYEKSCPSQWVKHFDRKRNYLQFKERIEKEGSMGLDVSDGDMEELVEGHSEELTTEELQELEKEEHKTKMDTLSSGSEEEEIEEAPSSLIKEIFAKWMDVKNFAEKYHPNKAQYRNSIVWN